MHRYPRRCAKVRLQSRALPDSEPAADRRHRRSKPAGKDPNRKNPDQQKRNRTSHRPKPYAELPLKQISRAQQADAEYRKALVLQQQGHGVEALAGYETALKLNAQHDAARLALVALLIENKRSEDAERVLQEGVKLKPPQIVFSMALARVQVEQGKLDQALETLQKNLLHADDKADYQAFYAAVLQRKGRHKEAVDHFQVALKMAPDNGVWLMGYGISLQTVERIEEAKTAYKQALATQTLNPALTAFVQQKLKGL